MSTPAAINHASSDYAAPGGPSPSPENDPIVVPPSSATPSRPASEAPRAMGRTALTGTLWMILSTASAKLLGLFAQLALAALLTEDEFGVFAIAISLSTAATVLRDGGIRQLLVQRKGEYESLIGPVAWMAFAFNILTGLVLAGMGPIAAHIYKQNDLIAIMGIMGLGVLLSTPSAVLSSRLLIELRFRELAWMAVASSALRYGSSVAMAAMGLGALSFVLPIPLVGILEWIWLKCLNRDKVWSRSAQINRWTSLLKDVKWILFGSLGTALINMGNYSVVGLFVIEKTVGIYFFAYQIVVQVGVLISTNINQVLFPIFSGMQDVARQRAAVDRAIRQLMLAATPLGMALIPMFPGIENTLWGERWASAVHAVMIIAAFYPISVVIAVPYAALQAAGRFREWALLLIALGAVVMLSGALGAWLGGTPESIALSSGIALALGSLGFTWFGLRHLGTTLGEVLMMTLPSWVLGLVAAGLALFVNDRLEILTAEHSVPILTGRTGSAIRAAIAGAVFCAVYGLLARAILPAGVRDAASMLPGRLRPLALRVLFLSPPSSTETPRS